MHGEAVSEAEVEFDTRDLIQVEKLIMSIFSSLKL